MINNWINAARAVKGMLDLGFSKKPEWVKEREQLRRGVEYQKQRFNERIVEPFKEGYHKDDQFWEVVKAHGEKRWSEIPARAEHRIYRGLCALSAASIFLVLALSTRNVIDPDSLLPSIPVIGMIYFAYKAFRTRKREGYVWFWRGTSECIDAAPWRSAGRLEWNNLGYSPVFRALAPSEMERPSGRHLAFVGTMGSFVAPPTSAVPGISGRISYRHALYDPSAIFCSTSAIASSFGHSLRPGQTA